MAKQRGREHTTLTETAALVAYVLKKCPNIKMIAPGEIKTSRKRTAGKRHLTITVTNAGLRLIVTGQSVQHVAVHTDEPQVVIEYLKTAKSLRDFAVSVRKQED